MPISTTPTMPEINGEELDVYNKRRFLRYRAQPGDIVKLWREQMS